MNETEENINKIKTLVKNNNIKLFIHAKYLLNFAKDLIPKNKIFLVRYVQDLDMSVRLGAEGVVLHFGTTANEIPRNEAIKKSKGEYLAFLDSDDWWKSNKIEKQIQLLFSFYSCFFYIYCN